VNDHRGFPIPETFEGSLRLKQAGERSYLDDGKRRSIVYEVMQGIGRDPPRSFLIFESVATMRRVKNYPNEWGSLDEPALEQLSWGR
jgi:hypothetical protein